MHQGCHLVPLLTDTTDHPGAAHGTPCPLPVHQHGGALEVDLGRFASEVERLVVDWPAPGLRHWTVIDTPGVASLSVDVSARAAQLLDPADGFDDGADAVIYLMRHVHAADVDLLKTLRGGRSSRFVNVVAVLSRADEIGSGRTDAMEAASAVAHRYRRDPTVRGVCLDVVTVAGLLAETGRTILAEEPLAVRTLARCPRPFWTRRCAARTASGRRPTSTSARSGGAACSTGSGCSACGWRSSCRRRGRPGPPSSARSWCAAAA